MNDQKWCDSVEWVHISLKKCICDISETKKFDSNGKVTETTTRQGYSNQTSKYLTIKINMCNN